MSSPELAHVSAPGQFLHVLCTADGCFDPLLRRPFSIHEADQKNGQVSVLYEIRGRGTRLLSQRITGELDILGPLGQGFTLPSSARRPALLIAGGVGLGPIHFLAGRIVGIVGIERLTFIIGAREGSMLTCIADQYAKLGPEVTLATAWKGYLGPDIRLASEDGSCGYKGYVTGLMEDYIAEIDGSNLPLVYACGPWPMLKAVAEITRAHGLKCQVSTEAKMACGVGACMSCVIKVRDGDSSKYVRSCKEGPVFDADEVIW